MEKKAVLKSSSEKTAGPSQIDGIESLHLDASSSDEDAQAAAAPLTAVVHHSNKKSPKKKTSGRRSKKVTAKNVPYTRTGDAGSSSLFSGQRRRKDDPLFVCIGNVDELCSIAGVVHALLLERGGGAYGELSGQMLDIMSRLCDVGAVVSRIPKKNSTGRAEDDDFEAHHVPNLERWVDTMTEELPTLTSFLLPSGSGISAQLHVARTVCRRAERSIVSVIYGEEEGGGRNGDGNHIPDSVSKYLNRLSDYFFTATRYVNWVDGKDEVLYCRPKKDLKNKKMDNGINAEENKEDESVGGKDPVDQRKRDRRRRIVIVEKEGTADAK